MKRPRKKTPLGLNVKYIDYKNITLLRRFTTYFWKIKSKYYSGLTLKQQKMAEKAIKRARFMALLPYTRK